MIDDEGKNKKFSFVRGWFTGFLFNVALVLLLVFVGYFYLTPNMLNTVFCTDIVSGDEEIDNMPLSNLLPKMLLMLSSKDDLSVGDLQEKYGIVIPVGGKLLNEYKDVKLAELSSVITNKIQTLSLNDMVDYSSSTDLNIDGVKLNYYYSTGKLYYDQTLTEQVDFDYSVDLFNNKIKILDETVAEIATNVQIDAKYIPIVKLIGELKKNSNDFTLKDISSFGIGLPKILKNLPEDTKLKDLESALLDMSLGQLFEGETYSWLNVLDLDMKVKDIEKNISNAITTKRFRELKDGGLLELDIDMEKNVPYINQKVGDLTLEMLAAYFNMLP